MSKFLKLAFIFLLIGCKSTLNRYPSYIGDFAPFVKEDFTKATLTSLYSDEYRDLNWCKNLDVQDGVCYFISLGNFRSFENDYSDCVEEFGGNAKPIKGFLLDLSLLDPDGIISNVKLYAVRSQDKDLTLRFFYNFPQQNPKAVVIFDDEYRSRVQDYIDCKERQKNKE